MAQDGLEQDERRIGVKRSGAKKGGGLCAREED